MTDPRRPEDGSRRTGPRWFRRTGPGSTAADRPGLPRELVIFLVAALLGLVVVGATSAFISNKIARDSARDEAQETTERLAEFVVAPLLPADDAPDTREALDAVMGTRVQEGSVLLAQVWEADGTIHYNSNDESKDGTKEPLNEELREAFAGDTVSDIDTDPESVLPMHGGPAVEVYTPFTAGADGDEKQYVLELYFDGAAVQTEASLLRRQLLPLTIGSLLVLELVQIPLAVSLGRRLSRQEAERRELVQDHLVASERERREIAADLHDGPVQDLAGVSYALSALRSRVGEDQAPRVDRMITAIRDAVASLRRLMVDIYPPDLSASGLALVMDDLAQPLRDQGKTVEVSVGPLPEMPKQIAAVLYRSVKEALVNVDRHAEAQTVWINLENCPVDGRSIVCLEVADDGRGLPDTESADPTALPSSGEGHLGLRLVRDRVLEAGGRFVLSSRPEGGALLTIDIPVDDEEPPR